MTVKDNYNIILENIKKACTNVGRDNRSVEILAVLKGQPVEKVQEAYDCGLRLFGENRTQEAEVHQEHFLNMGVSWHFIGKLQKNKINRVLTSFDFIQSVDGVKSMEHIHKRVNKETEIFIEINIGEEKNKSGFTVDGLKKALDYISLLDRLKITGLMAIPPFSSDPEDSRPYFQQLSDLKSEINQLKLKNFNIAHLSMGMSSDYEVAIEEGATIVRLGTALFGRRSI